MYFVVIIVFVVFLYCMLDVAKPVPVSGVSEEKSEPQNVIKESNIPTIQNDLNSKPSDARESLESLENAFYDDPVLVETYELVPVVESDQPQATYNQVTFPGPFDPGILGYTRQTQLPYISNQLENFSTNPNSKLKEVFVPELAIRENSILGSIEFSDQKTEHQTVKLIRSGTGFLIYDHPTVPAGKWLSCR